MTGAAGMVYLVGAGPGDPGLITVRGLNLLQRADVVVHDRLVSQVLVAKARSDAEVINAGKSPGQHRFSQGWIAALLVDRALQGKVVVRLKGGDPFVFGRGFEELSACRKAGVTCFVVPGVSSAVAAPAAAGIPLTVRGEARSFAVVTARAARGASDWQLPYKALAAMDTVVVLMGRSSIKEVTAGFMAAGMSGDLPAVCVEQATTPNQRLTIATLATLADAADRDGLQPPVVTVIGSVASYASQVQRDDFLALLSADVLSMHQAV